MTFHSTRFARRGSPAFLPQRRGWQERHKSPATAWDGDADAGPRACPRRGVDGRMLVDGPGRSGRPPEERLQLAAVLRWSSYGVA